MDLLLPEAARLRLSADGETSPSNGLPHGEYWVERLKLDEETPSASGPLHLTLGLEWEAAGGAEGGGSGRTR
jgi:hypothetical protein